VDVVKEADQKPHGWTTFFSRLTGQDTLGHRRQRQMEKTRSWCGQASERGWLKLPVTSLINCYWTSKLPAVRDVSGFSLNRYNGAFRTSK